MTNRDRLVLAAGELFYRNGYAATSVEDILEKTGVARSNFYYHFDGKLDLAREVLRRWVEAFEEHLGALRADGHSPEERLREIFREVRTEGRGASRGMRERIPCPLGPLALELAPHDPEVRQVTSEFQETLRSALLEAIRGGARSGEFSSGLQPEPAARVALATLQGALFMCHARGGDGPLREAEAALLELLTGKRGVAD